ncbi:hypothetical protein K0M31_010102, partial [Melipona bicolor]
HSASDDCLALRPHRTNYRAISQASSPHSTSRIKRKCPVNSVSQLRCCLPESNEMKKHRIRGETARKLSSSIGDERAEEILVWNAHGIPNPEQLQGFFARRSRPGKLTRWVRRRRARNRNQLHSEAGESSISGGQAAFFQSGIVGLACKRLRASIAKQQSHARMLKERERLKEREIARRLSTGTFERT